jgi:hypothetical protein
MPIGPVRNSGMRSRNSNTCSGLGPNMWCITGRRPVFGGTGGKGRGPCVLDSLLFSPLRRSQRPRLRWRIGKGDGTSPSDTNWELGSALIGPISIPQLSQQQDTMVWALEPSGRFSVRSLYLKLCQGTPSKYFTDLWWIAVPMKMRIFHWQLARKRLPSNENIRRRRGPTTSACAPLWGDGRK